MKRKKGFTSFELKLLKLLSQNARASNRRIAKLMKVSEATVRYHISKLEKQGIIRGYSVIIDPGKLELPIFITMGVQCEPALTKRVAEIISNSPYFYLVWVVTGAHSIHAKGAFPSTEEMQRVVGEVTTPADDAGHVGAMAVGIGGDGCIGVEGHLGQQAITVLQWGIGGS